MHGSRDLTHTQEYHKIICRAYHYLLMPTVCFGHPWSVLVIRLDPALRVRNFKCCLLLLYMCTTTHAVHSTDCDAARSVPNDKYVHVEANWWCLWLCHLDG